MSFNNIKSNDYSSLGSSTKDGSKEVHAQTTLKSSKKSKTSNENIAASKSDNLVNYNKEQPQKIVSHYSVNNENKNDGADKLVLKPKKSLDKQEQKSPRNNISVQSIEIPPSTETDYATELKNRKHEKQTRKDFELLNDESWITRNGHFLTYIGLYCFSILVYFRPYELVPALSFLSATAFYAAFATLCIYLPTQLATEGTLTTLTTEVKSILLITFLAVATMPIAKSAGVAWEEFNDSFIKAVVMFIVMVNVLRTRRRLMGIIWMSLATGFVLSYMALGMYMRGELLIEDYRVAVDVGGMFGNPNDMALHLVTMTPLAIVLGIASKNKLMKYLYFVSAALFVAGNVVTYSRGGFLGLVAVIGVLIWKLGKENRVKIFAITSVLGFIFIALAPGEYGNRIFSIFNSNLDGVGSSNQRTELLKRSLFVTLRNPWGIGIGNFPIVSINNLVSHNAYTQVSSELGIAGLIAYLVFIISPLRKLGAIERRLLEASETKWAYYLAVGLQASIVGYMVSSFFASVAYNWFIYYLIAYAVAFRRIYTIENGLNEADIAAQPLIENRFGWQTKVT